MENNNTINNTEENVAVESVAESNTPKKKKSPHKRGHRLYRCKNYSEVD